MVDYREQGQLTVAELIAELQKHPQDALVWHDGWDCLGAASKVSYDARSNSVTVGRCN